MSEFSKVGQRATGTLLLKNLRILSDHDAQYGFNLPQTCDVKIVDGCLCEISASDNQWSPECSGSIDPETSPHRIIDFKGAYASAGWIDLHTHVFDGIGRLSVPPDKIGLRSGVHMCVDAGTAGEATFDAFARYVVDRVVTRVTAYINISSIGLLGTGLSEFAELEPVTDCTRLEDTVDKYRNIIKAIKIRASGSIVGKYGILPLKVARNCARKLGLPLFVHIGEAPPEMNEVIDLLEAGDMVTHCFHGKDGGWTRKPVLVDAMKAAVDRGVLLDLGHGAASFSFAVARQALSRGILPYSISTDLHARSETLVVSLALTMSKMLALGMSLEEVVERVTVSPARWLHETEIGSIRPGAMANLTIFTIEDGKFTFSDSLRESNPGTRLITPIATVRGSEVKQCSPAG